MEAPSVILLRNDAEADGPDGLRSRHGGCHCGIRGQRAPQFRFNISFSVMWLLWRAAAAITALARCIVPKQLKQLLKHAGDAAHVCMWF
jgi:hypothetical protein